MKIKDLKNKYSVDVLINTRDRHTEMVALLTSLKCQTFQNWSLIILDDASGVPLQNNFCFTTLIERLKIEGHNISVYRQTSSTGVCKARNMLIQEQLKIGCGTHCLRLDDDVILEPDYIEQLLNVLEQGYDIATGIVPTINFPLFERENKFVKPIINEIKLDGDGKIVKFGDDCGFGYLEHEIIPAHHFRTNALYKTEIHEKIKYQENLSPVGFREETFFSLKAILAGYKIGCNTGAICWHYRTPSGGCRWGNYQGLVQSDDAIFKEWLLDKFKKHGNFLE